MLFSLPAQGEMEAVSGRSRTDGSQSGEGMVPERGPPTDLQIAGHGRGMLWTSGHVVSGSASRPRWEGRGSGAPEVKA